ncbi:MAG: ABC transporter permease [Erysipelotrichaceae bacterium]|nr:ABC transporter permease [Erysipelotrichaceae bacterium]
MAKYILTRIVKACLSIFVVVSIVIVMLFTMIPRTKVMDLDTSYRKMTGDNKTVYRLMRYDQLGYLDYVRLSDMCKSEYDDVTACMINGSTENKAVIEKYESNGYVIEYLRNGTAYGYHDYNILELVWNFWSNLIVVDNVNAVQDENNPDLERKIYIGTDYNGVPAVMGSGTTHKYLIYFDSTFPFIHQNWITFNFGISYPTKAGSLTTDVINEGQGAQVSILQTFPTGVEMESPYNQHTAKYKYTLDHLDMQKFNDNYADCTSYYESPSMVNTSYIFGIISLIIAYVVALPAGMSMARNKDQLIDKIGVVFINVVIAMPSLALIFFIRQIGANFGLPDKFPLLGFKDIRSYIVPMIILAVLSMPSLMTWMRRYMIDQSNSDYVKFARAKGLSQREIFSKHIMKNAIIPIVNGIPASVILCISGALITESAFAIPGMGKMLPDAISKMNNNMVITLTFIFAALSIFSILIGDLLMVVVDPRIQLATKKGGKKNGK